MAKQRSRPERHSTPSERVTLAELVPLQRVRIMTLETQLRMMQLLVESEPPADVRPYAVGFRDHLRARLLAHAN